MKSKLHIAGVLLALMFCGSCDESLVGFGGGIAASETLKSWQENLESKKTELQEQYQEVLIELEQAPDPNGIRVAKEKLRAIQDQQVANEAALLTVKTVLDVKSTQGPDRNDALFTGLIGAAVLAYQTWSKRKLGVKYSAHKAGQAAFAASNPEAAPELYAAIGKSRTAKGVT